MELNALTRWESIGKELYRSGEVGREIARLKARSKGVEAARSDATHTRLEYDASLVDDNNTPRGSSVALATAGGALGGSSGSLAARGGGGGVRSALAAAEMDREEREFLAKWRALREKGKRLRIEEDRLEQETVASLAMEPEASAPSPAAGFEGSAGAGAAAGAVKPFDVFPPGHHAWVYFSYRLLRRFAKGFLFGYLGKFAFAFVGLALRHKFNLARLIPDLAGLVLKKDLWSYGAFLGSFLTVFESSIRLLKMKSWLGRQAFVRHHRSVRVILSAAVAAATAMPFLPADTRLGISMFFAVRALEILTRWVVEREERDYLPPATLPQERSKEIELAQSLALEDAHKHGATALSAATTAVTIPSATSTALVAAGDDDESTPLRRIRRALKGVVLRVAALPLSNHFDTLVMALASAEVIWAWLFNRHTVEPAYLRFLDHQGGRTREVQHGYVQLHLPERGRTMDACHLDAINAARSSEGLGMLDLSQPLPQLMCCVLHRNTTSCTRATLEFFRKGFLRALPVYLPVYVLPMLLFKHRQLLKRPLAVLLPTLANLTRSSLFLSSYCTVCWAVACGTTHLGLLHQVKGALAGFSGGLTVAMEKKGRRIELALYVLSQALPSSWRTLVQWHLARNIPHGEMLVFIVSMSVIMWSYVTRPHLMRSSYLSLFLWFFGSGGRAAGFSLRALEHATPRGAVEDKSGGGMPVAAPHRLAAYTGESDGLASPAVPSPAATVAASALLTAAGANGGSPLPVCGSSSPSPPPAAAAVLSPGALVMQARHSSRLSTVQDEAEEASSSASPSPSSPRGRK